MHNMSFRVIRGKWSAALPLEFNYATLLELDRIRDFSAHDYREGPPIVAWV